MTDVDYIRAGVALADEWEIVITLFKTAAIIPPFIEIDEDGIQGWSLEYRHQGILDALAAQLARQMMTVYDLAIYSTWHDDPMKTIKAIVDSGKLSE